MTAIFSHVCIFSLQKMPLPRLEISDATMRSLTEKAASVWNEGVHLVKLLAKGENWILFLKVAE